MYVKAVANLHEQHCKLDSSLSNVVVRRPLVTTFLKNHVRVKAMEKRRRFDDRSINTLNDGYNKQEFKQIGEYFMREKNSVKGCRDRLSFLISHAILARSQNTCNIEFADCSSLELPTLGVARCIALVITINFGKTNQHGKIEYGSTIRHRDPETCCIGALAFSLFSRFHYENQSFPDFTSRENWYETQLLPSDNDATKGISYNTHSKVYDDAFIHNNIDTSKKTHASRKSAMNIMSLSGVNGDQQSIAGRWVQSRRVASYNSTLPIEALKSLADFDPNNRYDYFLPRAEVIPPQDLQKMIFPKVEYWLNLFHSNKQQALEKGMDREEVVKIQEDNAGPNFLILLQELRIVFLQVIDQYLLDLFFILKLIVINHLYIYIQ